MAFDLDLLFCSDFPAGFQNTEPEEKARRLAGLGFRVRYVTKLGIADPGPAQIAARVRGLLARGGGGGGPGPGLPVRSPALVVPRGTRPTRALNERWLERQLLGDGAEPERTVLWLRYPTPELLRLVERHPWRLVVYEVVDDHPGSPGMDDGLRRRFAAAETRVLARAGLVLAWSRPIAERLEAAGAEVRLLEAATDVAAFARVPRAPLERSVRYVGGLDFRLDVPLLQAVATALPDWRFTFAGEVLDERVAPLLTEPNVEHAGRIAPALVPEFLSRAAVAVVPFATTAFAASLFPIKLVEYLAAGLPVVTTDFAPLGELGAQVRVAIDAGAFAAAIVAAAAEDGDAPAAARRAAVAGWSWESRTAQMAALLGEALDGGG
jgi:glycosyltransferase involved in cell wall biosynthesis